MGKRPPFFPPLHRVATLLLMALLVWASTAQAGTEGLKESRRHLREIQHRIRRTSRNLRQKTRREHSLKTDLHRVDRELARIRRRIAAQSERASRLEREAAKAQADIDRTQAAVDAQKGKVRLRLTALYKEGPAGLFDVLFSADSPVRMSEDYDYLGRIVRQDKKLLFSYRRQLQTLEQQTAHLTALQRKQQGVLADLKEDRATLGRAQGLKKQLLAEVKQQRAVLASRLGTLRHRARALEALIKKLELGKPRGYTGPSIFASQKGHLPWPVRGSIKIGFGTRRHPELGTLYDSQGIEIAVSGKKPIAAVWRGKVVFANRFKGYGNLVIVDHGNSFYTLYAQASRLVKKVGDRVKQGETLAYSGFPGTKGVFFEIRHRDTPLDPTKWLAPR